MPFVKYFEKKHSGDNIAIGLDNMIRSMGFHYNQGLKMFSVNDNASNFRSAIKKSVYLEEINCFIHTVQLAVKDSFKQANGMNDALKKTRKIAKLVQKSMVARSNLKKAVESRNMK